MLWTFVGRGYTSNLSGLCLGSWKSHTRFWRSSSST